MTARELVVTPDLRRILADAKETLDCAELLDLRVRRARREARAAEVARLSALRESELELAQTYLMRAKAELHRITAWIAVD